MSHSAPSLVRFGLQLTQRFGGFVFAGFGGGGVPAAGLAQFRRVQLGRQQEPEVVPGATSLDSATQLAWKMR